MVLKQKRHSDDTIDKNKAQLVALGCFQSTQDVENTFSPVVDFTSVRIALTLAAEDECDVHQMDVSSAFLYFVQLIDQST